MKKVKIMLMSLTLLAIVGGALAFKAKFQLQEYCTTTTTDAGPNPVCPFFDELTTEVVSAHTTYYYTTPDPIQEPCFINGDTEPIPCPQSTTFTDVD